MVFIWFWLVFLSWIMCWGSIMCILYQCITLADVSLYPFTKVVLLLLWCYFCVCVCVFGGCGGGGGGVYWNGFDVCVVVLMEWGIDCWKLMFTMCVPCLVQCDSVVCFLTIMVKPPVSHLPRRMHSQNSAETISCFCITKQVNFFSVFHTTVTLKKIPFYNQFARKCQCNLNSIHLHATLHLFLGCCCGIDL